MISMIPRWGWIGLVVVALAACDRDPVPPADSPASVPEGGRGRIVFVGTSLTAGAGVDPSEAYPPLLQRKIGSPRPRFTAGEPRGSGGTPGVRPPRPHAPRRGPRPLL